MPPRNKYLTISVDDGHPTDLITAELLDQFDLKATFYFPKANPERAVMTDQHLRQIAKSFDVGGHTISHKSLKVMSDEVAFREINDGKNWLEDLTGQSVSAFCYPQGKFNSRTPDLIQSAGFKGARTCMHNLNDFPSNPYLWGLSTQAYSHSPRIHFQHALLESNFRGALNYFRIHKLARDWSQHFKNALDHVGQNGGIAHLYFHSWEIDEQGQWDKLREVLEDASKMKNFIRVSNSELFDLWPRNREAVWTQRKTVS